MSKLLSIAARNVRRNRRRTVITVVAISIGVTMTTLLAGFRQGMIQVMVSDVVEGRTGALQVHKKGFMESNDAMPTRLAIPYTEALRQKIASVPGVAGVAGRLQFNGLISNGQSQTMFVGKALDLEREKQACPRSGVEIKEGGQPLEVGDAKQVLLGYELAQAFKVTTQQLKAQARDEALVDLVNLQTSSPGGRANSLDVTVKGLSKSSFPFENKRVATVPLALAQELMGLPGQVTEYAVAVKDLTTLDAVVEGVKAAVGPEYEVHSWKEVQPFLRDIINRQQFIMGMISFVLAVIVLTGIVNTMLMSVFERVREIGTMLAVGVRRRQILTLFLFEAALIGLLGGAAGSLLGRLLLGLAAGRGIPLKLPGTSNETLLRPAVPLSFTLWATVVAMLGALAASAYPAWKASRLNPVDALRSN